MISSDPQALVEKHLPLVDRVVAIEKRKLGINDPNLEEDMRANAMVGLVSAAKKFDPEREASFRSYVELRMRYAIYDGIAAAGWFPRRLQRKIAFLRRATEMMHYQSQNPPPRDSTEAVHRLSNQLKDLATAYVTSYVEDTKNCSSVPPEAEDIVANQEIATRMKIYVETLPVKQRFVIEHYFYEDLNLPEIAREMKVSTSWVSKLLSAGLRQLREIMESEKDPEKRSP